MNPRIEDLCEKVLRDLTKMGASDASVLVVRSRERVVRFSDNKVTVAKTLSTTSLDVYLCKDAKMVTSSTSDLTSEGIERFVKNLVHSCDALQPSPDYTPLPKGPFIYPSHNNFDRRLAEDGSLLIDLVKQALDLVPKNKLRLAGIMKSQTVESQILTTGDVNTKDKRTNISLSVRAIGEEGGSGHDVSCACWLDGFDHLGATKNASDLALKSSNPRAWEEGVYDVVFSPIVAADFIQQVGYAASAFEVDAGISFLSEKLNEKVATESLTLRDFGFIKDGMASRTFDDEGLPTRENIIIEKGVLKGYLHNSTTARKFGTSSTANAGVVEPRPWNLVVEGGGYDEEELLKEVKRGILVTSNWYTRFQNPRTGEYSTLPRDAAFLIVNGRVEHPIRGLRLSGSILEQMRRIAAIGKERRWVSWWEVTTPVLTPTVLVKDVLVTKPY